MKLDLDSYLKKRPVTTTEIAILTALVKYCGQNEYLTLSKQDNDMFIYFYTPREFFTVANSVRPADVYTRQVYYFVANQIGIDVDEVKELIASLTKRGVIEYDSICNDLTLRCDLIPAA
jgi:hypothetical protein